MPPTEMIQECHAAKLASAKVPYAEVLISGLQYDSERMDWRSNFAAKQKFTKDVLHKKWGITFIAFLCENTPIMLHVAPKMFWKNTHICKYTDSWGDAATAKSRDATPKAASTSTPVLDTLNTPAGALKFSYLLVQPLFHTPSKVVSNMPPGEVKDYTLSKAMIKETTEIKRLRNQLRDSLHCLGKAAKDMPFGDEFSQLAMAPWLPV
ncbi:hypothetical protein FRC06_010289 [Ceratobasidium sp. 370]|nr:hypothetical protein FRC06_010289 [Ceratobasidium sp. 370]